MREVSVVMIDQRDIQDIRDIARENEEKRRKEQFHRDYKTALSIVREHKARSQAALIAVT